MMQAAVYTEYGPPEVLRLQELEMPVPQENEVLVRVHATTVNFGDLLGRKFGTAPLSEFYMPLPLYVLARANFGYNRPKKLVLGSEFAGEVQAVGQAVTRFKPGDPVFGYAGQKMGAYAEYLCMPEDGMVAHKPANLGYAEAATLPYGLLTAKSLLTKADLQPGQKVLINGASGSIGAGAVQFAAHSGAHVTGVCGAPRAAFVKALGAERVIDYAQEDFTQNGESYDLIFDVLGKSSFARCKGSLNPGGKYMLASFKMKQLGQMIWTSLAGDKKVICALSGENPDDLELIRRLAEQGVIKAVVDRSFPLAQAAEAHRYAESGLKQGPVVITVANGGSPAI